MPKLNAWQSAAASLISTGLAIGVALGVVKNQTAQLIIALVPSLIVNLTVLGLAIIAAIAAHTTAVTAAMDRRTRVLAARAATFGPLEVGSSGSGGNGGNGGNASSSGVATSKRYKTGRLKAVWPAGLRALAEYATVALAAPPATWGVPSTTYPMDGNDRYGCCTMAGVAHIIAALNRWLKKRDHVPTQAQVETEYFTETGGQDTGLVEANVLKKWMTVGLFGHKIKAYAPIKVQGEPIADVIVAIKQAVAFYGCAYLGILCPDSAQQQFQNGQPWTNEGEKTEDGHCIVALGYTADGILCATWGGLALVTWGFLEAYLEEVWAIIGNELVEAKGDTLGLDLSALEADLANA